MAKKEQKKYNQQYDEYTQGINQIQDTLGQRAGQGYNAGMDALSKYDSAAGQGFDGTAINRMRGVQEKGIGDYSSMVAGLYANPGYSSVEQRNMRGAVTQPTSAAFNTAGAQMQRRAAAQGNAGAGMAGSAEMAREKARTLSSGLAGLYGHFGDARRADLAGATQLQAAVPGMAGQQVGQEQAQTNMFQYPAQQLMQTSAANTGAQVNAFASKTGVMDQLNGQAQKPGFWSQLAMAGMSGAGTALSTMGGKPPVK